MEGLLVSGRFDFLEFFCKLFFGAMQWHYVVIGVLYMIGLWKMFEKSGIKGWWALIPAAREYQLSRCAGRESDGRLLSVFTFFSTIITAFDWTLLVFLTRGGMSENAADTLYNVLSVTIGIVVLIYSIRVYVGLIEVYGVKKRWMWLWVLGFTEFIPALVWGFSPKYQPQWKVEDIKAELAKLATEGSATVMDEGLTVNLKERSATEFFQKKVLLRDIHMSIPQGHMVLLLGGSGAGKTTYLNAINGYEKAKAEVMLNGSNMYTQYKKMQYEVGFVPQSEMMRGKDTVLNTLLDAAKLRLPMEVSARQRRERVDEVMEIFGLKPVQNNLVEKLSGGQKKRLSISMEFISNPSLFILDEPDSGLDGVMARELFVQLRKIADTGKIVIVITHTPDRVIDLFDDVIVLAKDSARTGRLAWYGSIEDARKFFQRERMEQIVKSVNRKEEGGDGLADEFVMKYAEVQHG
ncbi:MAG: ABC transporter ATP-binding protein [Clostridia bacterium]|nr:ABC transporter ATP-binding protein [Clostridia bacterium]